MCSKYQLGTFILAGRVPPDMGGLFQMMLSLVMRLLSQRELHRKVSLLRRAMPSSKTFPFEPGVRP